MAEELGLQGKTIVVTRAAGQGSGFRSRLEAHGATVLEFPALEIQPPSSWAEVDQAIAQLQDFTWLILTSANGVNFFLERVTHLGRTTALADLPIAVVGEKTAQALHRWGHSPSFIPPDFIADALVDSFPEPIAGQKILFPRVESGGRAVLVQAMTTAGARVTEVPAYGSGCPAQPDPATITAIAAATVDVITFASSKTVRHSARLLHQGLGEQWHSHLAGITLAAIGPQTAIACRDCFGRVDLEAPVYTLDGLLETLLQWANGSSD